jgi:hypothetical protein
MSLQTEWMRQTDQREVYALKDKQGHWCIEYVNHPTPSGEQRWMPTYEDNRRWPTEQAAREEFGKLLTAISEARQKRI